MNETRIRVLTAKLNAGLLKQAAIDTRQAPPETIKVAERFVDPKDGIAAQRAADISRGKGVEAINRALGGVDPRLLLGGVGALGGSLIGALSAKKRKWLYALLGGAIGGGVGALGGVGYKAWADAALSKARAATLANYKDAFVDGLKATGRAGKDLAIEGGKLVKKVAPYAPPVWLGRKAAETAHEMWENATPAEKAALKPFLHPIDYATETAGKALSGSMSDTQRAQIMAKQIAKGQQVNADKALRDRARAAFASIRENAPTEAAYHTITGQRAMRNAKGEIIEVEPENKSLFGWLMAATRKAGQTVRNDLSDLSYAVGGSRIWDRQKNFEPDKDVKTEPALPKELENISINDPRLKDPKVVEQLEAVAKHYTERRAKQDPEALKAAIAADRKSRAEAAQAAKNAIDLNELWQNR